MDRFALSFGLLLAAGFAVAQDRLPYEQQARELDRLEERLAPGGSTYEARGDSTEVELRRQDLRPSQGTSAEVGEARRRLRRLQSRADALPSGETRPQRKGPASQRTRILPFAIPETDLTLEDLAPAD